MGPSAPLQPSDSIPAGRFLSLNSCFFFLLILKKLPKHIAQSSSGHGGTFANASYSNTNLLAETPLVLKCKVVRNRDNARYLVSWLL